jgi:hypothetical protein
LCTEVSKDDGGSNGVDVWVRMLASAGLSRASFLLTSRIISHYKDNGSLVLLRLVKLLLRAAQEIAKGRHDYGISVLGVVVR